MSKPWDKVECETMHYGAWDSGTRTIYKTPIPLWEETTHSGHPILGNYSEPRFTAFPESLPGSLPTGSIEMGIDQNAFPSPVNWINFGANEDAAFLFAMSLN